jgi:hypothetical protein
VERRTGTGRTVRRVVISAALVGALVASVAPLWPAGVAAAPTTGGALSGVVFQDFNADGARNLTPSVAQPTIDVGVGGIGVAATCLADTGPDNAIGTADDAYAPAASTTTGADGAWTLAVTGSPCRVTVDGATLPPGFQFGPHGVDSGTSVQFVDAGATGVDVGVVDPESYCQDNPQMAVSCFVFGDQSTGPNAGLTTLEQLPYDASGETPPITSLAEALQIGSTWGLALQRESGSLFAGSFLKRHAGFGPGGPGAIYRIDRGADGSFGTPDDAVSTFLDLGAAAAGADPHPAGTDYFHDIAAYSQVAKGGLGDLELSSDGTVLFAVGLASRQIYRIPIGNPPSPGPVTTIAVPDPGSGPTGCVLDPATPAGELNLNVRPFGLGSRDGLLYVGAVCTGESSQQASDLRAFVWSYDGTTFTPVLNVPLNYSRGVNADNFSEDWRPWNNTLPPVDLVEYNPQPILSDIVFDGDDIVFGLRDRYGDQTGRDAGTLDPTDFTTLIRTVGVGDILRACSDGAGGYALEQNGGCGGVTTAGAGTGQGPGGGEFYFTDSLQQIVETTSNNFHLDVSMGGLAQLPGSPDVSATSTGATKRFFSGGIRHYGNTTGLVDRSVTLYAAPPGSTLDRFGKANGLGDLELLCDAAPIEIGNRIWLDRNRNGVQDPGEPGIPGVTVSIGQGGSLVGSAVTDANGDYYFGGLTNQNLFAPNELLPSSQYTLALDNPPDYAGPLVNLALTPANAGPDRAVDSNATLANPAANIGPGNFPSFTYTTGGPGANDHTLDVGFSPSLPPPPTTTTSPTTAPPTSPPPTSTPTQPQRPPVAIGDYVWIDVNRDGIQDADEPPIPGVTLHLYDCSGMLVGTDVTDADGRYLFDDGNVSGGLRPDTSCYQIRIDNPADFRPGGPLNGYQLTQSTAGDDRGEDSNGVPFLGIILTNATTPSAPGIDLTYDFGFFPLAEFGTTPPAFTGADTTRPLRLALGLIGLGGILVLAAGQLRQRRRVVS